MAKDVLGQVGGLGQSSEAAAPKPTSDQAHAKAIEAAADKLNAAVKAAEGSGLKVRVDVEYNYSMSPGSLPKVGKVTASADRPVEPKG